MPTLTLVQPVPKVHDPSTQPFSPLPFTIPKLYFGMQSKAVWAKKRMWAAGLSGGGQDWATQAATSEKLVFLQPGDFCHPDTGPRPAPPDLLPIFGLRDLDSKSAPGSASDAAAVIPRVYLLTQLLHHLTLLWKQIYLILASSEKAEWEPVRFHSVTN